jgi:hypothetical protein
LQFGKTTVTGVYSEQKSETKLDSVTALRDGTLQDYDLFAQEYDCRPTLFSCRNILEKNYDKASFANYPFNQIVEYKLPE